VTSHFPNRGRKKKVKRGKKEKGAWGGGFQELKIKAFSFWGGGIMVVRPPVDFWGGGTVGRQITGSA